MKYGDHGPEVQEMQESLIEEGFGLPRFGADGHYGSETQRALNNFETSRVLTLTPKGSRVSDETLDALGWDVSDDPDIPDLPDPTITDVKLYDLRDEPWESRLSRKFRLYRDGKPAVRDPSQITGITIHQTAAPYGVADYQVRAAGGDRQLALARRSLRVACHVMAYREGFIAWANELTHYVYHGNGFNASELGIEIDGRFPGVKGGKTWNGKPATEVTDTLVHAARAGIELLTIEGRKAAMPIEYIHAHRQSSATRRDDPGEELWQRVVLDFAVPVLGLITEPARTLRGRNGNGRPIPKEWDPDGVGSY